MNVLFLGAEFMLPYWAPELTAIPVDLHRPLEPQIQPHRDATFAYAMNTADAGGLQEKLWQARDVCRRIGIPTLWHTIEDPNSHATYVEQARGFDLIATSDAELIPSYAAAYPKARILWLPLAAQPALHRPAPVDLDAADCVLIANWYTNEARLAAVRMVLDPLLAAGYTLELYAYDSPAWPVRYRRWWKAATSCYDVARYYPRGRIALGMNNQAWKTAMTSMRTFEVLACEKPFLSFHSDAYERLGFRNGEHFVWTDDAGRAVKLAAGLLGDPAAAADLAARGRSFVLERHTYAHRLEWIRQAL